MAVSVLNGGAAFAGKTGRSTANACETNTTETNTIAAAHFISRGLTRLQKHDKKNYRAVMSGSNIISLHRIGADLQRLKEESKARAPRICSLRCMFASPEWHSLGTL